MANERQPFTSLLAGIVDNRGRTCPTAASGLPLIATNCVRNDFLYPRHEKVRFVDNNTYLYWFRGHPRSGDLLFVTKGAPGRVCMVPDPVDFCIAQDMVAIRADDKKVYPRFLLALLRSEAVQEEIDRLTVGTLIPHFKKGDFDRLLLTIPDRATQQFIGDTYFSLSAKIDLNRRMSDTLEAMARALFKSWFVDFDPVHAKAEGRDSGLLADIAALFPDSFQESDLGEIPKTWRGSTVGAELTSVLGGTPSRGELGYWEGGTIPWINSGKANEFRVTQPSEFITKKGLECSATKQLPERTTIVAITGATLGKVSLLEISACANQSIVGILGSDRLPSEFIYFWVREHIDSLVSWQTGGAQQHINKNNIDRLGVLCPPSSIIQEYICTIRPVFDRIRGNCLESGTLAALRDTLLPKLLSGELRVPQIDEPSKGYS